MNTVTITKVVGALCGSLLVFLLGGWGAQALYSIDGGHGAHGEEAHGGYIIAVGEQEEVVEEEGPSVAELLAAGDPGSGEKVFNKCKACHKVDGNDATGPHLNGVVGREIGAVAGFNYSGALQQAGVAWTPEILFAFLENPKGVAPGTSMSFAGLNKETDRADLIAYLATTE